MSMCVHFVTIDKFYYVFLKCVNKDIIIILYYEEIYLNMMCVSQVCRNTYK